MYNELKNFCSLNGISGRENNIRNYIIEKIKNLDYCYYIVDNLGNLIVECKGKNKSKNKVMLASHMDEVGMIVSYITDEGFIKFQNVGSISDRMLTGKKVLINNHIGVIDVRPTHLVEKDENTIPKSKDLYIDIGSSSREETEKIVSLGDEIYFNFDWYEFGENKNRIQAKALDDRLGCLIMLDMITERPEYDLTFVFTVQEEIGCRGATVASNRICPDYAVVIETTTASDIEGVENEKQVCSLGKGAVVSFMDKATIYDKEMYDLAFSLAKENNIPVQTKTLVAGANDSGAIHKSGVGVKTLAVSVPCRYLHSPSCVIDKNDGYAVRNIVKLLCEKIAND